MLLFFLSMMSLPTSVYTYSIESKKDTDIYLVDIEVVYIGVSMAVCVIACEWISGKELGEWTDACAQRKSRLAVKLSVNR